MADKIKYPRTFHLPWSPGRTDDDKTLKATSHLEGKEVVITEKMDGENTTLYCHGSHARSLDSPHHVSRDWIKQKHSEFAHDIPPGWRVCGENLYAKHSIAYEDLPSYFMVFSIWNEKNIALSWDDTVEWSKMLGLKTVPVIWRGEWDEKAVRALVHGDTEGYVVRNVDRFHYDDFKDNVAKFVRSDHIQPDDKHWRSQQVVPNKLKKVDEISEDLKDHQKRFWLEFDINTIYTENHLREIQDDLENAEVTAIGTEWLGLRLIDGRIWRNSIIRYYYKSKAQLKIAISYLFSVGWVRINTSEGRLTDRDLSESDLKPHKKRFWLEFDTDTNIQDHLENANVKEIGFKLVNRFRNPSTYIYYYKSKIQLKVAVSHLFDVGYHWIDTSEGKLTIDYEEISEDLKDYRKRFWFEFGNHNTLLKMHLRNAPVKEIGKERVGPRPEQGVVDPIRYYYKSNTQLKFAINHLFSIGYNWFETSEGRLDSKNRKIESINTTMLPFIEELLETRVLRNTDDLQNRSSHDLADLIFLTVLALNIIKYYNSNFSANYARGTNMFNGFDGIRSSGTDLHNYLSVIINMDRFMEKLRRPSAPLSVPKLQLVTHLNTIGRGIVNHNQDNGVLLALQQELKITNSNYKSIRRLVQDWHRTMPKEKAHATTRLLQAFRSKAPNADIFKPLEAVARMQDLELKDVLNPEKDNRQG